MIFNALMEAATKNELILMDGGLCHFHLRQDGQLTIREIIVLPGCQGQGIGTSMLDQLKQIPGATSIFAKCPWDLQANQWYLNRGFTDEGDATTRTGKWLRKWRLQL
jgi:N-acetylglutamate synthase-like GNAT family acetyltransferase